MTYRTAKTLFSAGIVGPPGSSDLQPGQLAGPGLLLCARKERLQQALPGRERQSLSWPQPIPCCLVTWRPPLKCHFLSGSQWVYLLGPLLGLLVTHRLASQAFAAQNSFMRVPITGSRHSNSQPCWARPACAAGPVREGVGALVAKGAWV